MIRFDYRSFLTAPERAAVEHAEKAGKLSGDYQRVDYIWQVKQDIPMLAKALSEARAELLR